MVARCTPTSSTESLALSKDPGPETGPKSQPSSPFPSHLNVHPTGLPDLVYPHPHLCSSHATTLDPLSNHPSVSLCPPLSPSCALSASSSPSDEAPPPSDGDTKTRIAITMHRTYSMRATRAPTASQIQVIPPSPMDSSGSLVVDKSARTPLRRHPQPSPAASLAKEPSVSSPPALRMLPPSGPSPSDMAARTCPSSQCRRRVRAGPGQEAVSIGQDGEERHAKHGAGRQGEDGGCRTTPQTTMQNPKLTLHSNNSRSGARPATKTYRT